MTALAGFLGFFISLLLDPLVAAAGVISFQVGRSWRSWPAAFLTVFLSAIFITALVSILGGGVPKSYFVRELIAVAVWFGIVVLVVRAGNWRGIGA